MKKLITSLLLSLTLLTSACGQQPAPALSFEQSLLMAFQNSRTLAVTFAAAGPAYIGAAYYFQGRAEAFADAYALLTGHRPE